jgi:hypothetical protein
MTNTNVFPIQKANRLTCRWIPTANGPVQCVWTINQTTLSPSRKPESQAVRLCA